MSLTGPGGEGRVISLTGPGGEEAVISLTGPGGEEGVISLTEPGREGRVISLTGLGREKRELVMCSCVAGDGSVIQDYLLALTGDRTVPRVFVGGKCIGGGGDTVNLHQRGELVPMLKSAGAL